MAEEPIQPENAAEKKPTPISIKPADKKSDTTRIDLASAKPPPSILDKKDLPADADDYFKRSTMRIDLTPPGGDKKSETTRIDIPPVGETVKKQTAKMDLPGAAERGDVFPAKAVPVGIPATPAAPPTRPKTLQIKKPMAAAAGESIIVSPESTASATEQARKSETARIDLTAEDLDRPATKPKTIRIKRPDGTSARKALTISRPEGESAPTISQEPVEHVGAVEESSGILEGIVAIAALLVAGVLFYVLLGQTLAPDLPFPGRI